MCVRKMFGEVYVRQNSIRFPRSPLGVTLILDSFTESCSRVVDGEAKSKMTRN